MTLESKLRALRETAEGSRERRRAEAAFVVEARPFLLSICRWYRGPDLPDEDLLAEAELAFVEAMREWKPGGRPFDTYARWGVRFALARMLRASRMIRGRGRDGRVPVAELTDPRDFDAQTQEFVHEAQRAEDVAGLREALNELAAEDQAVVAAWLADSRGRALPVRLRDRLREMVG